MHGSTLSHFIGGRAGMPRFVPSASKPVDYYTSKPLSFDWGRPPVPSTVPTWDVLAGVTDIRLSTEGEPQDSVRIVSGDHRMVAVFFDPRCMPVMLDDKKIGSVTRLTVGKGTIEAEIRLDATLPDLTD